MTLDGIRPVTRRIDSASPSEDISWLNLRTSACDWARRDKEATLRHYAGELAKLALE